MNPQDMKLRTNLSGKMAFRSFIPPLTTEYHFNVESDRLESLARSFHELNDIISRLSKDDVLQLVQMEAADSWRLSEDTEANPFSFVSSYDNENIRNIVRATMYGADALSELPVSTRLIRNIHYLICESNDYDRKYRGEYRKSPVWIGPPGKGITEASFVPPVDDDMKSAIADLDKYINYSNDNIFVKAAVIHYQFEMIHPFVDGNGRTGRLLNNLFLTEAGILPSPALLVSHIITRSYNRYCDEIQYVNLSGDLQPWIKYWLDILVESCVYTKDVLNFSSRTDIISIE